MSFDPAPKNDAPIELPNDGHNISSSSEKDQENITDNEQIAKTQSNGEIQDYISFVDCGENKEGFYQEIDLLAHQNADEQLSDHIQSKIDNCEPWFDKLNSLTPAEAKQLTAKLKEKQELIDSFSPTEFNEETMHKASGRI